MTMSISVPASTVAQAPVSATASGEPAVPPPRAGGALLCAGGVLLLATCLLYVLAGPVAALPGGAADPSAAIAATASASGWMRRAGTVGMASDVLLAMGCALLALDAHRRQASLPVAGWVALGVAGTLFVVVDAMVAQVLPVAAGADAPVYAAVRALFDVLFGIGAWAAGLGALLLGFVPGAVTGRGAVWLMRIAGVGGFASAGSFVVGGPGAALIGPSIAVLALASIACGWTVARTMQARA